MVIQVVLGMVYGIRLANRVSFFLYIIFELSQLFDVVFDTGGGPIDFF